MAGLMRLTDIDFTFDGSKTIPVHISTAAVLHIRPTFDEPTFPVGEDKRHLWTITVSTPKGQIERVNVLETETEILSEWARATGDPDSVPMGSPK